MRKGSWSHYYHIWSPLMVTCGHRMPANEMAAQLLKETIQRQAVDALSPAMPGLKSAMESGDNKLSASMPEFQYQLEVRQTGTSFKAHSNRHIVSLFRVAIELVHLGVTCF